jgi:hypothetical protein
MVRVESVRFTRDAAEVTFAVDGTEGDTFVTGHEVTITVVNSGDPTATINEAKRVFHVFSRLLAEETQAWIAPKPGR